MGEPAANTVPDNEIPARDGASVFLALPHCGSMCPEAMVSIGQASAGRFEVEVDAQGSSLLVRNFNALWATALNQKERPAYFAMHHSDVAAPPGWVDVLIDTLERENAGMASAVIAIKSFDGLTSTAALNLDTQARRRLTVRETLELPPVFDARDVAKLYGVNPESTVLLVNTGLWICRFAGEPWIEGVHFETGDDIRKGPDGKWQAHVFPEDWLWSATLAAKGVRVVASRVLPIAHFGRTPFAMGGERKPWGGAEADAWVPT